MCRSPAGFPQSDIGFRTYPTTKASAGRTARARLAWTAPTPMDRGRRGPAGNCVFAINRKNDNEPYSFHPGGANFLFVDAHVQFIDDTIPLTTLAASARAVPARRSGEQSADDCLSPLRPLCCTNWTAESPRRLREHRQPCEAFPGPLPAPNRSVSRLPARILTASSNVGSPVSFDGAASRPAGHPDPRSVCRPVPSTPSASTRP